jgi:hypothetical protein
LARPAPSSSTSNPASLSALSLIPSFVARSGEVGVVHGQRCCRNPLPGLVELTSSRPFTHHR